ncbi:uncharacterized protein BKA78DRAFT_291744 [Phyllosticta capitalensis]|uniref:uncharacterized protein n=1 Tax=Phyllosticta capitalensis TaxID=121624 RepID=UPI00313147E6
MEACLEDPLLQVECQQADIRRHHERVHRREQQLQPLTEACDLDHKHAQLEQRDLEKMGRDSMEPLGSPHELLVNHRSDANLSELKAETIYDQHDSIEDIGAKSDSDELPRIGKNVIGSISRKPLNRTRTRSWSHNLSPQHLEEDCAYQDSEADYEELSEEDLEKRRLEEQAKTLAILEGEEVDQDSLKYRDDRFSFEFDEGKRTGKSFRTSWIELTLLMSVPILCATSLAWTIATTRSSHLSTSLSSSQPWHLLRPIFVDKSFRPRRIGAFLSLFCTSSYTHLQRDPLPFLNVFHRQSRPMDIANPASSIHSRNENGDRVTSSAIAPTVRKDSLELVPSPDTSSQEIRMTLSNRLDDEAIRWAAQAANRLLFYNGLQTDIVEVSRLLHVEMRAVLSNGPVTDAERSLQHLADILGEILVRWESQNQSYPAEIASLDFRSPPKTPEKASGFSATLRSLPVKAGCELNLKAAQNLQEYFISCVVLPFATMSAKEDSLPHDASRATAIRSFLLIVRRHLNSVVSSAERLYHTASQAWEQVYELRERIATAEANEDTGKIPDDIQRHAKHRLQAMLDRLKGRKKGKAGAEKKSSSAVDTVNYSTSDPIVPMLRLFPGITQAGKRPRLAALPPAPLNELEKQQADIKRYHGITRLKKQQDDERTNKEESSLAGNYSSTHEIDQSPETSVFERDKRYVLDTPEGPRQKNSFLPRAFGTSKHDSKLDQESVSLGEMHET